MCIGLRPGARPIAREADALALAQAFNGELEVVAPPISLRVSYPVAVVETTERGDDLVDVVATLVSTSVVADELDAVTTRMEKEPGVEHATWESNAAG